LLARSANGVRRCFRNAEAASCNFCSIWAALRGSKVFRTSPVAGLVVAIAMLILSLRLVGYASALFGLKQRTPSGSGLVVEPQYYLTGRPRQGYTFKSPEVFQVSRSKAVAECATEVLPSSLGFGGRNAFSVEWHSVSRHRQPAPCRLCTRVFANRHWTPSGDGH